MATSNQQRVHPDLCGCQQHTDTMFRPVASRIISASCAAVPRVHTQVTSLARLPARAQPLWRAPARNGSTRPCSSSSSSAAAEAGTASGTAGAGAGADGAAVIGARLAKALGVLQVSMMGVAGWEFFSTRALQDDAEQAVAVMDKAGSIEQANDQQLATVRASRDGVMRGFLTTAAAAAAVAALSVGSVAIAVVAGERLVALLNMTIFGTRALRVVPPS